LWDLSTGTELFTMTGHTDKIQDLAINQDFTRLATASHDGSLKIWDLHNSQMLLDLPATDWMVRAVDFSPDGEQVASVIWGYDESFAIKVWDVNSGDLLHHQSIDEALELDYSPDGDYLALSQFKGTTVIFDITKEVWREALLLSGHSNAVANVYFSDDGKRLTTGSSDGTARIWSVETGEELVKLTAHKDAVAEVKFSPDGKKLVTLSYDGFTRIFTLDLQELIGLAENRVTRTLTQEECQRFLHQESCPE